MFIFTQSVVAYIYNKVSLVSDKVFCVLAMKFATIDVTLGTTLTVLVPRTEAVCGGCFQTPCHKPGELRDPYSALILHPSTWAPNCKDVPNNPRNTYPAMEAGMKAAWNKPWEDPTEMKRELPKYKVPTYFVMTTQKRMGPKANSQEFRSIKNERFIISLTADKGNAYVRAT